DGNLRRYVGNSPTNFVDPSGLYGVGDLLGEAWDNFAGAVREFPGAVMDAGRQFPGRVREAWGDLPEALDPFLFNVAVEWEDFKGRLLGAGGGGMGRPGGAWDGMRAAARWVGGVLEFLPILAGVAAQRRIGIPQAGQVRAAARLGRVVRRVQAIQRVQNQLP